MKKDNPSNQIARAAHWLLPALLAGILIFAACSKDDNVAPIPTDTPTNYVYFDALADYDPMHDSTPVLYALRTDSYSCENLLIRTKDCGWINIYSYNHLHPDQAVDSADLVSPEELHANHQGVAVCFNSCPLPDSVHITSGKIVLRRWADSCKLTILGATDEGSAFQCHYSGPVFDLTALDSVGFFAIEHYQAPTDTLPLRMGFLEQDTSRREYYLLGSRPNRGINIISYVDIAGKTLPVTTNFELVRSGQAVSVGYSYQSNPYTPHNPYYISTYVGQITCSSYGDVYFIESSMLGGDGENTSFRYTGPIHRAPSSNR